MITLAIDTTTHFGGICLFGKERGLIGELRLGVKRPHSEHLMNDVDFLLRSAGMDLAGIDFYTIAIGPGSFTGLRVGLSTVKGLSFATGRPVVAVSALEAFASLFPFTGMLICPLFDARKKEVYAGLFRWTEDGLERVLPEAAFDVKALCASIGEETIFAGTGAVLYRDQIKRLLGKKASFPPEHLMHPLPSGLSVVGLRKAERGEFSDPVRLTPVYLRRSEAELKRGG